MIGFWILSIACGIGGLVLGLYMAAMKIRHRRMGFIGEPDFHRKPIVMYMLFTASGPIGFFFYASGFADFEDAGLWTLTGITLVFALLLYAFTARRLD